MIVLFTDFGLEGPYIGQMQAVLQQQAPGIPVINLFSDLTPFAIQDAACLLPAYTAGFPAGSVFLCVVDPGVGGARPAVVVQADARWYVGPDEGLFVLLARRARRVQAWRLPTVAGAAPSFHGRDVFAPAVAYLARNRRIAPDWEAHTLVGRPDWPDDPARVLYIDRYGNAITGVRAATVAPTARLSVAGRELEPAPVFSAVAEGEPFWYANSSGLLEIAVNQGRADTLLQIGVGTPIGIRGGSARDPASSGPVA